MSKVKVKIRGIEVDLDRATLYRIGNRKVWLPHSGTEDMGDYVVIDEWLAKVKDLPYKYYYNHPPKIEPIFNQSPLDELKYNPK